MDKHPLTTPIQQAKEALRTLLKTLAGTEFPLEATAPKQVRLVDDLRKDAQEKFALCDPEHGVTVVLAPAWVSLFSEAMLGEAMDSDSDAAADLMQEVGAQGFGVVQTALAGEGYDVPALTFEAILPGQELPAFEDDAFWGVPFSAPRDGMDLDGFVLLPSRVAAESADKGAPDEGAAKEASATERSAPAEHPSSARSSSDTKASGEASSRGQATVEVAPAAFEDLGKEDISGDGAGEPGNFEMLAGVNLEVTVELGRRHLPLADVLKLTTGSVVELEKLVGEPLSVYANGRLIAEGEAVVIDEQFGVRITNLASKSNRNKAFF